MSYILGRVSGGKDSFLHSGGDGLSLFLWTLDIDKAQRFGNIEEAESIRTTKMWEPQEVKVIPVDTGPK